MTTNFSGSSSVSGCATIYTFPPRGRFAIRDRSEEFAAAANVQLPRGVKLVSGSGWYHDAAIQESIRDAITGEQGRKN
jgi:hypothetical protein